MLLIQLSSSNFNKLTAHFLTVPSSQFAVIYNRGELSAYGVQLTRLKIRPSPDYFFLSFIRNSESSSALIKGYENQAFVLQGAAGRGCRIPADLNSFEVADCRGGIQVIDGEVHR